MSSLLRLVALAAFMAAGCSASDVRMPEANRTAAIASDPRDKPSDGAPCPHEHEHFDVETGRPGYSKENTVTLETNFGDGQFRSEQVKALEGDAQAAFRVAQMFAAGTNGVPRDEKRMVLWLRHASDLQHGAASYRLYLYYLDRGLDRAAVYYENRALEQGFVPPPRLDHRRGSTQPPAGSPGLSFVHQTASAE